MILTGAHNFRDLGGIKNRAGQVVKTNKLFRSDDLHALTDEDLTALNQLPLRTLVDFRSENEVESSPNKLPSGIENVYQYSMNPGNMSDLSTVLEGLSKGIDSFMEQMYITLISNPDCLNRYKNFFALLKEETNTPLLFHCSAGKDRTGIATALILSALNVDEAVIMENYLESNIHLKKKYGAYLDDYPQFKDMFLVKPNYLSAALAYIKENNGSVDNFLRDVLEIDVDRLKELYLEAI